MYACEIKETTDGSWGCACGEARQAYQVVAQRSVAPNGEVNEYKRAAQDGEDEAQGQADAQAQEKVEVLFGESDSS